MTNIIRIMTISFNMLSIIIILAFFYFLFPVFLKVVILSSRIARIRSTSIKQNSKEMETQQSKNQGNQGNALPVRAIIVSKKADD